MISLPFVFFYPEREISPFRKTVSVLCIFAALGMITLNVIMMDDARKLFLPDGTQSIVLYSLWILVLLWFAATLVAVCWGRDFRKANVGRDGSETGIHVINFFLCVGAVVLLIGVLVHTMGYRTADSLVKELAFLVSKPVYILNLFLIIFLAAAFCCALGNHMGLLIFSLLSLLLLGANVIKLRYHNSFFSWLDLLQIKEMFLVAGDFLKTWQWIMLLLLLLCAVALLFYFRKSLAKFLAPRIHIGGLLFSQHSFSCWLTRLWRVHLRRNLSFIRGHGRTGRSMWRITGLWQTSFWILIPHRMW